MRAHPEIVNAVAARYIRAFLVRQSAWSMDMLARLSVLEGAAGVPPGKWLAQRERGFASALDHFGPGLAASWTSATDRGRGLYDQAVSVANHALRNVSGMDGEELIQELLLHSTSGSGPKRQKVFYSIGEALSSHDGDLRDGKVTPDSPMVRGRITRWVENAARDVLTSWREKHVRPFSSRPGDPGPVSATTPLSDEQRDHLLLLALQSPGGSGSELRRIIDGLIDRGFSQAERPIVRSFIEKISHPKYRSPSSMRELVQNFNVNKWFTQAFNLVRREIMNETGISAQRLTNILGSDAAKVFRFMSNVVGKDTRVRAVLADLAEEIELLEPGAGPRVASRQDRALLVALLGNSIAQPTLVQEFEKDQFSDWDQQAQPSAQFSRGPVELRVATEWVRRCNPCFP